MTFSEILNASKTFLYLTGKDAYIREHGICTHSAKSNFASLLNNRKDVVVVVNKNTAPKYAKAINRLGYILNGKADYSSDEYILYYQSI